jgi:hypothetical protein
MKKKLLFAFALMSGIASAQTFTQANEPSIGETSTMFLVDSFATNYDAISGAGVTWDYSSLIGYTGETRDVQVVDATTTADAASYPTSTKAYLVGTSIVTYFNSTASERTSQGFKFTEPSLGDVLATFENDEQIMLTYPFALGNSVSDSYDGSVTYNVGMPVTEALNGDAYAWFDGEGTMLFPGAVTVNNVMRYKSVDTAYSTAPLIGAVEIIREQYEYYDHASQNLPIFIHATITMQQPGGAPLGVTSMVLSKYPTTDFASITEANSEAFVVYPNPAEDKIHINGNFNTSSNAVIFDQSGRVVLEFTPDSGKAISIAELENGMYTLSIEQDGKLFTKQIIKK